MRRIFAFYIVMIMLVAFTTPATATPVMDGIWDANEWKDAQINRIELNIGIVIELHIIYTTTHVYYLALVPHDNAVDEVNLDPAFDHDYFGIEFDNNKDEVIMGTSESPDDTILVNYEENTAADMYMADMTAYYDEENGGVSNTEGKAGYDQSTGNLVFEISKPLQTGDNLGHDIQLTHGEPYQIMIAFWDDKPPHSSSLAFNKRIGNDQFLTLIVGPPIPQTASIVIASLLFVILLGLAYFISKNGLKSLQKTLTSKISN